MEDKHVVILKTPKGDKPWLCRMPLPEVIRVPVPMARGFGAMDYHWDGKERSQHGFPVYR